MREEEVRSPNSGVRIQGTNRTPAKTFQDVVAWQKAHEFVLEVYRFTENFPNKEVYGLTSQFRRAALSIPANIAEGFKKRGRNDKVRFLNIAQGSLEECRYYLLLARDLGYGKSCRLQIQIEDASKLPEGYMRAILNSEF